MRNWPADGAARCAHCDLPVVTRDGGAGQALYCCLGCRMASTLAGGRDGPLQFLEARLLLAAFLAMGVMTFSLVLYGEDLHAVGDEPGLAAVRNIGRMLLAVFALPVLLLLAPPLAAGAFTDLRRGVVRMDGLVVLAVAAAYGLSLHATWTGTGQVYYETATMVLVLVTFGRRLEAHARSEGRDAAELLADWLPETVTRLGDDGAEEQVAPDALVVGDRCLLAPGQRVPADVVVEQGRGAASCAHVTGESARREVGPGDELPAGAENGHGVLTVRVLRDLGDGTLGRLRELLTAPLPLTPSMRLADRLASVLTMVALALAAVGAFAAPDAGAAVTTALSVLLVACPCALGLATPLAYRAMRSALARQGLLVRDAAALERLVDVERVVFDKTGTLTLPGGRALAVSGDGPSLRRMAALVRSSGHALADAFAADDGRAVVSEASVVPGRGVEGLVDGRALRVGRPEWVLDDASAFGDAARSAGTGSLVASTEDGRPAALVSVTQALRPEAADVVAALRDRRLSLELLSGDRPEGVAPIAETLGMTARADATPEDKLARLHALRDEGCCVLAVGDGLNDAPALRGADVSVAMGTGTATTRAVAAVEIVSSDLRGLLVLFDAGRRLRRIVRGNLSWSVAYNGVALAFAVSGRLHPLVAALAMIASSLVVSMRCHRLLGWRSSWAPPVDGPSDAAVPGVREARADGTGGASGVPTPPRAPAADLGRIAPGGAVPGGAGALPSDPAEALR